MKRSSLTVVVLVILALIVSVIVVDFINHLPDRRGGNPYALETDEYRNVDPALISHRETRNLSLGAMKAMSMTYTDGKLYVVGDSSLVIIRPDGRTLENYPILPSPTAVLVQKDRLFIAYETFVAAYDPEGVLLQRWEELDGQAVITNLAAKEDRIYVADAGGRRVVIFSRDGERLGAFEGIRESELGHGFIVPSPNFDLAVNVYGELWVVNPGRHAFENYSDDGRMRGYWENLSFEIEGFLGCCNPARITVTPDGHFVTSEKGMVRIKIYDESGKLLGVVATPDLFKEEGKAPDVCVDSSGVVYALDFDRNMIRIFEPVDNG
jgi:hypothetical protein